jgi:ribonuclease R
MKFKKDFKKDSKKNSGNHFKGSNKGSAGGKKNLQGTIKRNADGFGFFIPDDAEHPDVYIPRHSMTGIMTNDKVIISVEKEKGGDRFRGDIVKVVERGTKKIVGQYFVNTAGGGDNGTIKDEGKGWGSDLKIRAADSMGAKDKQLVVAEVTSFPDEGKEFRGKIVEILGDQQDPLVDIRRAILSNNIPDVFSPGALKEASRLTPDVSEEDMKGRKDLRPLKFVTIDGATAKDFDDAVYVESNKDGFKLYVAIADVSHYVTEGSEIDKCAYERGTSVYFPNFVVPMLPEILSNHLCSLNPHVPRLSLVAEMQINFEGDTVKSDFYEAVILSHARVTYGEAQEIVEGQSLEKLEHVKAEILRAADLAKILMARRFRLGSLDLEIPETQLVIDAGGNPIDINRSERLFAHRLIEEMMLAANVAVATYLSAQEIPAIYRIHEQPKEEAIRLLERYLQTFGGRVELGKGLLQKRLTKALQEFEGKPQSIILNILALRSMTQAKYSENNVGHFGLGFEFYTHFTSPIRRYPDLIVHRLLKNQIYKNAQSPSGIKYRLMSEDELRTAGTMLSACEQRSVKAERQLIGIKKARFMHKHLGDEFDGVISSVTRFGVFVLLRTFEIDGLIRLDDLGQQKFDRFEFDEENLQLVSSRSGMRYSIGDVVKIRVVSADIEAGQINFELASRVAKSAEELEAASTKDNKRIYAPPINNAPGGGKSYGSKPTGPKTLSSFLKAKAGSGDSRDNRDSRDSRDNRSRRDDVRTSNKDRFEPKKGPSKPEDRPSGKKTDKHADKKFSFYKKSDKKFDAKGEDLDESKRSGRSSFSKEGYKGGAGGGKSKKVNKKR